MAKKLNLSKVSENLTPKERAKLVVSLQLKDLESLTLEKVERGEGRELSPTTEQEIARVVSACPPEQTREYNFYVDLEQWVWTRTMPKIESLLLYLDVLDGRVAPLRFALTIAPSINYILELVKSQPAIVTREEYEKAVKKAQKQAKEGVLELEGRHNLAEEEAFYRLLAERKIEGYDLLDEWLCFIDDRYGKTEKELIQDATAVLKHQVEEYQKAKDRMGSEPTLWKEWSKYVGLSDEELGKLVRKEQPEELEQPTKKEYELWQKSVKEERERILQAVKKGELKWIKRRVKSYNRETKSWYRREEEGIQAGSYYTWKGRYQKYAGEEGAEERGYNPLAEDCLEIGLANGKVRWSGDLELEGNYKWQSIAIATPHNKVVQGSPKWVEREQGHIASFLESLLLVKIDDKNKDEDKIRWLEGNRIRTIRPAPEFKEVFEEVLRNFVTKTTNTLNEIHNCIALVEAIEERHFDGMQIVSRDSRNPLGTVGRALVAIRKLADDHNNHLREVVRAFGRRGFGLYEVKFENLQDCLLNPEPKINQEWVEEELTRLEEEARGNG